MDQSDMILKAIEQLSAKIDTTNRLLEKLLLKDDINTMEMNEETDLYSAKLLYSDDTTAFAKSLETSDLNEMTSDYPMLVTDLLEALENSSEIRLLPPYGTLNTSDILDAAYHPIDKTLELILANLQRVVFELDASVVECVRNHEYRLTMDGLVIIFPQSFSY